MNEDQPNQNLTIFGAAPDTPNLGVSALFASAVSGLNALIPTARFCVFDNNLGLRTSTHHVDDDHDIQLERFGARAGLRFHRPENLATMAFLAGLGSLGRQLNQGIRLIDNSIAALDISGGDSFSDIYGKKRFYSIIRPKMIAIKRSVPLILMPQTYGPYNDPHMRNLAVNVLQKADMVWARDADSFDIMKDLMGESFDESRHFQGVDLAFRLNPRSADQLISSELKYWISREGFDDPLVGINVSGLIYKNPSQANYHFGFKADYAQVTHDFLTSILSTTKSRVVLIPHVMDEHGHYESDHEACQLVHEKLAAGFHGRVAISPRTLDQSQAKWLISKMDWFCGTRMHSTIASLSSSVPTACIAYSDKTKGVFETCGQGDYVIDPRTLNTQEVVSRLKRSFEARVESRENLLKHLPNVIGKADHQLEKIANRILHLRTLQRSGA